MLDMSAKYDYGATSIVETEAVAALLTSDAWKKAIARFVILSKLSFKVVEFDSFKGLCKHF